MMDVCALISSLGATNNSSSGTCLPDFPEEHPSQDKLDSFFDAWDTNIAKQGYTPLLNDQDPPSLLQFKERDLNLIPEIILAADGSNASIVESRNALRAQVTFENDLKREQKAALKTGHSHRLAQELITHLRPHAGLRLATLLNKHVATGTAGQPDATYDGFAMYKELRALKTAKLSKPQRDTIKERLRALEKTPLKDGCSEASFNTHIEHFVRDINPYLDRKYEGEALGEWIIEAMPPSQVDAGIALMRELRRDGALGDSQRVIEECQMIIAAHAKSRSAAPQAPPLAGWALDSQTQQAAALWQRAYHRGGACKRPNPRPAQAVVRPHYCSNSKQGQHRWQ